MTSQNGQIAIPQDSTCSPNSQKWDFSHCNSVLKWLWIFGTMIHISMSHNPQQHLHVFCFLLLYHSMHKFTVQHHISMIYFNALQHNILVFPLFTFALNVVMLYTFTKHEAYLNRCILIFKVADCSVHWHTLQCFILQRVILMHIISLYTLH